MAPVSGWDILEYIKLVLEVDVLEAGKRKNLSDFDKGQIVTTMSLKLQVLLGPGLQWLVPTKSDLRQDLKSQAQLILG